MVCALDSGTDRGPGLSPTAGTLPAFYSQARHFTFMVPVYTQGLSALA